MREIIETCVPKHNDVEAVMNKMAEGFDPRSKDFNVKLFYYGSSENNFRNALFRYLTMVIARFFDDDVNIFIETLKKIWD